MSPAEPYCHACGVAVGGSTIIELERVDAATSSQLSPPRSPATATPTPATATPGGAVSASHRWRGNTVLALLAVAALSVAAFAAGSSVSGGDPSAAPSTSAPAGATTEAPGDSGTTAPPPTTTAIPTTTAVRIATKVPTYSAEELREQYAAGLGPIPLPPLGEAIPFELAVVDDTGTAHLIDMATGLSGTRLLATGSLEGTRITEVAGGPRGPIALRASMTRYGVTELEQPDPRWVEGRVIAAYDEDTGWYWFGTCFVAPCEHFARLTGYGPLDGQRIEVELPTATPRVVATDGKLYVEAAGSVVLVEPRSDERTVVATGRLLDARGGRVVVRSCAIDLACPVYVVDVTGAGPPIRVELSGDDIGLAPDGNTLVSGASEPLLATTLALVDTASGRRLDVDADVLRFVSVPFRWSPDGDWLFGATATRTVVALRISDGEVQRFPIAGLDRPIAGLLVRNSARD
jgi:hypothetical protein